jgi:alkanesulfonate monooxygenase SsuD/methylene tetrahydromethanopterin reductase-like flavin-dependent oxidoreductase (luciferase family)
MTKESRLGVLVCVAVEGRFLQASTVTELRERALRATHDGAAAVLVGQGPLGDPFVLAAGLGASVPETWVGVRFALRKDARHPAMLARDMTSLDLVTGGRSALCFEPPFTDDLAEAIALCRALWRPGVVESEGPTYPAQTPATRARPLSESSPLVGLDLTTGESVPSSFSHIADLLLHPTHDPMITEMERL